MSFRGFGASGTGEADQRGQRARRSPIDESGEEVRATIRDHIGDDHDTEVRDALCQSFRAIQDDQRPSMGVLINKVAQLVDLAGISPRDAILRMAGARFDYQAAAGQFLEELEEGTSSLSSLSSRNERGGDPDKVEGPEERDTGVSDDTEEESEPSSAEDSTPAALRRTLAANPGIDRSVARRGHPDQSKLMITIRRPDGGPSKVHRFKREVDFRGPVGHLNRWRAQIFRRHFGGSRPFRQHFHELEKDWLLQEHIDFEKKRLAQGKPVDYKAMRWSEIVERFNRRFEGQYLPGVKTPRPSRTKVALFAERSRVKKITDHTGLPFRAQRRREGSKRGPTKPANKVESVDEEGSSDEGEDETSDDAGKEKRGPQGTPRGDPPPGKKPWRKDGDDKDGGGGVLGLPIFTNEIGA